MTPLHADAAAIVSTVAGSTSHRAAEVAAFLAEALQAQGVRASAARATAAKRHEQMRDRIIAAAGAMLPTFRGWAAAVRRRIERNPARYGFDQVPDMRTIRKAHRHLLKNGTTPPSCTPLPVLPLYAASSST